MAKIIERIAVRTAANKSDQWRDVASAAVDCLLNFRAEREAARLGVSSDVSRAIYAYEQLLKEESK